MAVKKIRKTEKSYITSIGNESLFLQNLQDSVGLHAAEKFAKDCITYLNASMIRNLRQGEQRDSLRIALRELAPARES